MAFTGPREDESSGSPFGPPLDALGPDPAAIVPGYAPTSWRPADPEPMILPPSPQNTGRNRIGIVVLGSVATIAVGVAALTYVVVAGRDSEPEEAVLIAATSPPTTRKTAGPLPCVDEQRGSLTIGRGPGDHNSGPGVILGFEHAFYSDRNGEKARSYVAPDADTVGSAPTIQRGIDEHVPLGTTYCAQINQISPDNYELDLTERRPGGTSAEDLLYTQLITTTVRDGQAMITAIVVRGQ
ncbi:hypothetical protein [Nocardia sp. XZ_19_231]|uniref:hypothetical protein n=1 Tax=Nocardia sp. XZ_19_231 TaxID=2769252 RepID=UPI0018903716|nr:hypothetical protein [Nocardia sp. XZ_19_231]